MFGSIDVLLILKCFPKKKKSYIKPRGLEIQSDWSLKKPENKGVKK
jgi:hypothetical protein